MKSSYTALLSGMLFSLGLVNSGMTQPKNVIGFLDIFGEWNPSLMWVMVGGIAIYAAGYRWVLGRKTPLYESGFSLPTAKQIDRNLVIGSLLFGMGWGLAGFCPGPAITSAMSLELTPLIFVGCMLLGMFLEIQMKKWKTTK